MELSRRDLIGSVTAGIAPSTASAASTKAVPNLYPGPASIGHQALLGPQYTIRDGLTLCLGILGGKYGATPRVGGPIRVAIDFPDVRRSSRPKTIIPWVGNIFPSSRGRTLYI